MTAWIRRIILVLVGLFFVVAALMKVVAPGEFAQAVLRYQVVGPGLAIVSAFWIPWMELVATAGLLLPQWRRAAIVLLLLLLCLFQIALISAWWRGLDIDCGCLGTNLSSSVSISFFRNLVLMAGLTFCMRPNSENRNG